MLKFTSLKSQGRIYSVQKHLANACLHQGPTPNQRAEIQRCQSIMVKEKWFRGQAEYALGTTIEKDPYRKRLLLDSCCSWRLHQPLGRVATRLRGISSMLNPGSSVWMRSYCSLDFSYFRTLHPGFFVSLYFCMFDVVFCMLKSYSLLLGFCNMAQWWRTLPSTGHAASTPGTPGKPSKIIKFQACPQGTKSHQNWSQSF